MKKKLTPLFIFLLLLGFAPLAHAQITITAQLRPRAELRQGYKKLPDTDATPAFFIEQRSRITFGYLGDRIEIKAALQDIRIWGSTRQLNKSDDFFSVHEAWGKFWVSPKFYVKAGRMELVYDDHRILGNVGWTQQARSHDLVQLGYEDTTLSIQGGLAFNQDNNRIEPIKLAGTLYTGVANYKHMQYVHFKKTFKTGSLSILALNQGLQVPSDSSEVLNQNIGAQGWVKLGRNFKLDGTFYYQRGQGLDKRDKSAFMGSATLTFKGIVGIGGDYLSGSEYNGEKNNSFVPLYGTNHKFYGLMDYFYAGSPSSQIIGSNKNQIGLIDLFIKFKIPFGKKLYFRVHGHQFLSPVDVISRSDSVSVLSRNLGTEIDVDFRWKLVKDVTLRGGYSNMFGTESLQAIKGGDYTRLAYWAWLMIDFNPVIFQGKKK